MDNFKQLVERSIANRKVEGVYATSLPLETCQKCYANVEPRPAVCWGQPVEGFVESGLRTHQCPPKDVPPTEVSTDVKEVAEFVVMVSGHSCFITSRERELYLEAIARGHKVIEIRHYVFDRLYAILPYSEWREQEEKRNRRTEAYMAVS